MDIFPFITTKPFGQNSAFLLASTIRNPLYVDMYMQNQRRPYCARIKVEVDLLRKFSKKINVGMKRKPREIIENG